MQLALFVAFMIAGPAISAFAQAPAPPPVPPATSEETKANLCSGANLEFSGGVGDTARQCNRDGNPQGKINDLVTQIVNVFSILVGIVAVIMIIYGGFRYITSGGDSGNVTTAKNTILYAIVGLVIVAFAQIIVKFVLNKSTT